MQAFKRAMPQTVPRAISAANSARGSTALFSETDRNGNSSGSPINLNSLLGEMEMLSNESARCASSHKMELEQHEEDMRRSEAECSSNTGSGSDYHFLHGGAHGVVDLSASTYSVSSEPGDLGASIFSSISDAHSLVPRRYLPVDYGGLSASMTSLDSVNPSSNGDFDRLMENRRMRSGLREMYRKVRGIKTEHRLLRAEVQNMNQVMRSELNSQVLKSISTIRRAERNGSQHSNGSQHGRVSPGSLSGSDDEGRRAVRAKQPKISRDHIGAPCADNFFGQ